MSIINHNVIIFYQVRALRERVNLSILLPEVYISHGLAGCRGRGNCQTHKGWNMDQWLWWLSNASGDMIPFFQFSESWMHHEVNVLYRTSWTARKNQQISVAWQGSWLLVGSEPHWNHISNWVNRECIARLMYSATISSLWNTMASGRVTQGRHFVIHCVMPRAPITGDFVIPRRVRIASSLRLRLGYKEHPPWPSQSYEDHIVFQCCACSANHSQSRQEITWGEEWIISPCRAKTYPRFFVLFHFCFQVLPFQFPYAVALHLM